MSSERLQRGAFITVEGGDGAGKTTHIALIGDYLRKYDVPVVRTREPGGTELGEELRRLLLRDDLQLADQTELMLMFTARMQHLETVIRPALQRQQWVLCDRFTDATYAYQGGGRGIDRRRIALLENWVQGDLRPDLTLLLDVPVDVGALRVGRRASTLDRFERQSAEFKQAVRAAYLELASRQPNRVKVIAADRELQAVQRDIVRVIEAFCRHFCGAAGE